MTISEAEIRKIVEQVIRRVSVIPATPQPTGKTIVLGADHGGFAMKEALKPFLTSQRYTLLDCGTHSSDSVDYPDLAYAVARLVANQSADFGIIIDGAGIGSCMAANKVPGIRAAMCYNEASAKNSREHNHANVLTLGAGMISQKEAEKIVTTWLNTPVGPGRHARRANMIMEIEARYLKSNE